MSDARRIAELPARDAPATSSTVTDPSGDMPGDASAGDAAPADAAPGYATAADASAGDAAPADAAPGDAKPEADAGTGPSPLAPADDRALDLWLADGSAASAGEPSPTVVGAGLVSLGFLRAELRRTAWVWCLTSLLGLMTTAGLYVARPPAYSATATILLAPAAYPNEILDDQEIAQSRTVAAVAVGLLGLRESPASFLNSYTVAGPTDRILIVTTKASSSQAAVSDASAVASAFLKVQVSLLKTQDNLVATAMQQQIAQAQQKVDSASQQVRQIAQEPASPAQRASLAAARNLHSQAVSALASLEQASANNQASMQTATTTTVKGSRILDAAVPIIKSRLKLRLMYAVIGLIAGMVLGMALVVVRALTTDRLRRRDDVARMLGAPVRLSVGSVTGWRLPLRRRRERSARDRARLMAYLSKVVPVTRGGGSGLAVVAVDDCDVAASCLVAVAREYAHRGLRVVVADLCPGAPAARMLEVTDPGLHDARDETGRLQVAVPEPGDPTPPGPLLDDDTAAGPLASQAKQGLSAGCASAQVLLTLVRLDPAVGADYLAGWARSAVVFVRAGRCSAEELHSAGEMIRLAGLTDVSAVLVGADKADHSLGLSLSPAGSGALVMASQDSA